MSFRETSMHNPSMLAAQQLQQLRDSFAQFAQQQLGASTLGEQARAAKALLDTLPARYGEVLLNLLDRLESSALFTEESCSFSQKDLIDNLKLWADKAQAQLQQLQA